MGAFTEYRKPSITDREFFQERLGPYEILKASTRPTTAYGYERATYMTIKKGDIVFTATAYWKRISDSNGANVLYRIVEE